MKWFLRLRQRLADLIKPEPEQLIQIEPAETEIDVTLKDAQYADKCIKELQQMSPGNAATSAETLTESTIQQNAEGPTSESKTKREKKKADPNQQNLFEPHDEEAAQKERRAKTHKNAWDTFAAAVNNKDIALIEDSPDEQINKVKSINAIKPGDLLKNIVTPKKPSADATPPIPITVDKEEQNKEENKISTNCRKWSIKWLANNNEGCIANKQIPLKYAIIHVSETSITITHKLYTLFFKNTDGRFNVYLTDDKQVLKIAPNIMGRFKWLKKEKRRKYVHNISISSRGLISHIVPGTGYVPEEIENQLVVKLVLKNPVRDSIVQEEEEEEEQPKPIVSSSTEVMTQRPAVKTVFTPEVSVMPPSKAYPTTTEETVIPPPPQCEPERSKNHGWDKPYVPPTTIKNNEPVSTNTTSTPAKEAETTVVAAYAPKLDPVTKRVVHLTKCEAYNQDTPLNPLQLEIVRGHPEFQAFIECYPKKEDIEPALREWNKLIKNKGKDAAIILLQTILPILAKQNASISWNEAFPKYIKSPKSYLADKLWTNTVR